MRSRIRRCSRIPGLRRGEAGVAKRKTWPHVCTLILCALLTTLFICRARNGWAFATADKESKGLSTIKHAVTVPDMIGMVLPSELTVPGNFSDERQVATFSPDGKRFVVVLQEGQMATNGTKSSLLLFQTRDLLRRHESRILCTMTSLSNRPGIDRVRWQDNGNLIFLGSPGNAPATLYVLNVRTEGVTQLIRHKTNIFEYDFNPRTKSIVFAAEQTPRALLNEGADRHGILVQSQSPDELLGSKNMSIPRGVFAEYYALDSLGNERRIRTVGGGAGWLPLRISPDGRYAIAETILTKRPPQAWSTYANRRLQAAVTAATTGGEQAWIYQLELINLRSGHSHVLLNSPIPPGDYPEIVWAADSRRVAAAMLYLPLEEVTDAIEVQKRRLARFAVEIEIKTGATSIITEDSIHLEDWRATTKELRGYLGRGDAGATKRGDAVAYKKSDGKWARVPAAGDGERSGPERFEVFLKQSMNEPPKVVARDVTTGESVQILDPNPKFSGLTFGEVREVSIARPKAPPFQVGLYLPVGYRPSRRYPLVIQTHGWNPNKFWIDGPFTSAFAAQALAGAGIVVAQLDDLRTNMYSMADVETAVQEYDAVIQYLDREGIADSNRVGIIGFSITGASVTYALTHSRYHFAAATLADISDFGYFAYLITANSNPNYSQLIERVHGGPPAGDTLHAWLDSGLDFGLEKTSTPLRFEAYEPFAILLDWEPFTLLRSLRKAAEMIYLPDGDHVLVKPWNRYTSQQGNVDWFRFWLQRYEDPDPSKRDQYIRWRQLEELTPSFDKPRTHASNGTQQ
jgi:dipeptidyl aminopeptidase/acylaminoacyl peptidase